MKINSRGALQEALDEEDLVVEDVEGELAIGNRRGLNILHRLALMSQKSDRYYDMNQEQNSEINWLKSRMEGLESPVASLSSSVEGQKAARGRFISTSVPRSRT